MSDAMQTTPREGQPADRRKRASRSRAAARVRDERGITTAEYAVGTAAGAGLAGLLYTLLTGGLGKSLITQLYDHVLGLIGLG